MSDEVFRSVNKYMDYSTGEEHFEYSKAYDKPGPAKSHATRMRYPYGKSRPAKVITNRRDVGGAMSHFEFLETWCERAKEWERV
jgi:hypothetical protein